MVQSSFEGPSERELANGSAVVLQEAMPPKRKAPEEALSVAKRARSRSHGPLNNGSANSTPAAAMMTTSTRATARREACLTGTPAPATKGKEVRTSYENTLRGLADVVVTDHVMLTLVNSMLTYATGQEELVREFKMAMAELVRSYLTEN